MNRSRRASSASCMVLCVLGLVICVVTVYSRRALFDPAVFSNRVAASLDQPPVARVVAGQIADQIIALQRDLTAYRPIMVGVIGSVVSSSPFRAAVRRAARTAHAALISAAGEDLALNVTDFGIVARNALSAHPEIAAKVPQTARVAVDMTKDWPAGKILVRALRAGHRMRVLSFTSLAVAAVAGAGGFLIARRKERYLLDLGLGLLTVSVLAAGIARFGGGGLALLARHPIGAELARGLWPAFVGPLALRMLVLGLLGLVLVAAVTSLLERVSVKALARRVAARVAARHGRMRWALFHGALLTCAGILVLFNPEETLVALAVAAGAVALFAGIREIFMAIVLVVRRASPAQGDSEHARPTWRTVAAVSTLTLAVCAAGAYWLGSTDTDAAATGTPAGACNGYPQLCDRRLDQVAFPATHNSMSGADDAGWMFPNQEAGIAAQLEDGVRGFLIDIHYGEPVGEHVRTIFADEEAAMAKNEAILGREGVEAAMRIRDRLIGGEEGGRGVYSCHGFCELGAAGFAGLLEQMREFLVANPAEVVIIVLQDEGVAPADVEACFAESGLDEFVYRGPAAPPWPTMRDLVGRDERVLVFAENETGGLPWYHRAFEVFQETPYRFTDPSEFSNKPGRGGAKGSLLLLNHWIETAPAPLPSNAEIVNAYDVLHGRAAACRRKRGMTPTLVAVDFYRTGDLFKVVRALNGIPEPAP